MGIDPHTKAARHFPALHQPRRGHKSLRVFGVDPALQRMAVELHILLAQAQHFAPGHAQLLLHDVDAGGHFRDRVLDLQTGVHLDKKELAVFIQKLESAHAAIADLPAGGRATLAHTGDQLRVDTRRRGFFQHFLVTALQGTIAATQPDRMAVGITEHLNFDMTRVVEEFFDIQFGIAKRQPRFFAGQVDGFDQVVCLPHHAHAAPAATTGGLDDHRVADVAGNGLDARLIGGHYRIGAGHAGYAGLPHGALGRDLVAHGADAGGAGADKRQPGGFDALGKTGVFGEKTVARMDRLSTADLGRKQQRRLIQIALAWRRRANAQGLIGVFHILRVAVGFGMHHHGFNPQPLAGTLYTQGDFATVGDQYFVEHGIHLKAKGHGSAETKQRLASVDFVTTLDENLADLPGVLGLDRMKHLHRLDNGHGLPRLDLRADRDKGRLTGRRGEVQNAVEAGLDFTPRHSGRRLGSRRCRRALADHRGHELRGARLLVQAHRGVAFGQAQFEQIGFGEQLHQPFDAF